MASNGSAFTLSFSQLHSVLAKRRIDKFRPFRGLLAKVLSEKFDCGTLDDLLQVDFDLILLLLFFCPCKGLFNAAQEDPASLLDGIGLADRRKSPLTAFWREDG